MYEAFFNLTMKPFELLPNPDFLFLSRSHRKVLMYLDYGIQERAGFILLTGPIGSGKTTIIRDLIKKRDRRVVLSKIFNTKVDSDQLLAMINDDFGLSSGGKDKITLLRELNDFLIDQFVQGNQPILIIDEAQNLSVDLLEEIRMLSNLETDQAKLLQIILVGQPELRETLATPALMQLRQRMKINCTIQPLTAPETEQYILHRLETAGNREAVLFSQEALETIFAYSRGIPRLINIICDFLMLAAFAEETRRIGREMVNDIVGDLDFENHFWGETANIRENPADGDALPGQRTASDNKVITATLKGIRDRIDNHAAGAETLMQDTFPDEPEKKGTGDQGPGTRDQRPAVTDQQPATSNQPPATSDQRPATCAQRPEPSALRPEEPVKEGLLRRVLVASGFKIFAALGFLFLSTSAGAANYEFHPSLTVGEEYTDNVFETSTNKREDYITRVRPGFAWQYKAPFWDWDITYNFDYRNYARGSRSDEYTHNAVLRGNISLLDNFLFLELSDTYRRVTLDVTRNAATESSLFLDQTDQNTATISPYLLWRLGENGTLRTGYRYSDIRYWGDGIERREQGAFADLNHQMTSRFSLSAGYAFTHLESQPTRYNRHDLSGGFRYEYAERSFVYGQIGNSWQQFDTGLNVNYLFWNAGVNHDFSFAVATVETRVQTAADPLAVSTRETSYTGRLERALQRGMVGFSTSYSEFANTQTDSTDRRRLAFTGTGRYEVLQSLTASLAATAERFYMNTGSGFQYHLNATSGLSYAFNRDLTLSLNYTYDTQRNDLDNATGAIDTNRVVVEVRKIF